MTAGVGVDESAWQLVHVPGCRCRSTVAPDVVNGMRQAVAQLATAASAEDAPAPGVAASQPAPARAASPAANGTSCVHQPSTPARAHDMLALNGFSYLSSALDEAKAAGDAALAEAIAGAVGAEEAQQAVLQLMRSSLTAAAERVLPQLPSLDLQSAIVPATQELDLGSCKQAPCPKPPVPPDEARPAASFHKPPRVAFSLQECSDATCPACEHAIRGKFCGHACGHALCGESFHTVGSNPTPPPLTVLLLSRCHRCRPGGNAMQ